MPARDDSDDDRRGPGRSSVPCPRCGSRHLRAGPWPWYLGTVGAMLCKAVVCDDCGHEFDKKKPHADLPTRKRNPALLINGVGLLGILAVFGLLALWLSMTLR